MFNCIIEVLKTKLNLCLFINYFHLNQMVCKIFRLVRSNNFLVNRTWKLFYLVWNYIPYCFSCKWKDRTNDVFGERIFPQNCFEETSKWKSIVLIQFFLKNIIDISFLTSSSSDFLYALLSSHEILLIKLFKIVCDSFLE